VVPVVAGPLSTPADLLAADASLPVSLELHRVHVPLARAHRSAHGVERHRTSVLVRWEHASGAVGWGECPALSGSGYVTEPIDAAWTALTGDLGRTALRGAAPSAEAARSFPASTGALADARLDAVLRANGRPLTDCWSSAPTVDTTHVLALVGASADEIAAEAAGALRSGATALKVKVVAGSASPVVRCVLEVAGSVPVAADANGSFDPGDDASSERGRDLSELVSLPLAYLEQPFPPAAEPQVWADLAGRSAAPLAVDESATSEEAVVALVRTGAAAVVSVKPARLGGLLRSAQVARAAAASGASVFVGGMFELGVGRSSALALAASGCCDLPTDLGPSSRYVEEDVTEDVVVDRSGRVVVPRAGGAASAPVPERLERHRVGFLRLAS
jgi:O-succinylbenzoate synthase